MLKTYDELAADLWWNGLDAEARKIALDAVGAKDDEAGRGAAWLHHKATREAELTRHPSVETRITE